MTEESNLTYQEHACEAYFGLEGSFKRRTYEYVKNKPRLLKKYLEILGCQFTKVPQIPNIHSAKRILDIGCGPGIVDLYIRDYFNANAEFIGTDIDKNQELPHFVTFIKCNIENDPLPFENNSMDIILSSFVLEHLKDPFKLFVEANRILKTNGYLYLITEHVRAIFLPDHYNFYQDPTHTRPHTKRSLTILSRMTGFEICFTGIVRLNLVPYLVISPFLPIVDIFLKTKTFPLLISELMGTKVCLIAKKK